MTKKETEFKKLAQTFKLLEETSSSLKMIDILGELFSKISPEEARISAYLFKGEVAPSYRGLRLGLANKLVIRAIARVVGTKNAAIEKMFNQKGDLGSVVEELIKNNKEEALSIREVFKELKKIALISGEGSQDIKINTLSELIRKSSPLEARYIIRLVLGILRLGLAEMTFLYGLSKALTGSKEKKKVLEHAYNVLSDLGEVVFRALKNGIASVEKIKPMVGVPIRMMMAQRIEDLEKVKKHIPGEVMMEYKYDGERIQAHIKNKKEIVLFSRRHDNITAQFPDIVSALEKSFQRGSAIVEGEAVAIDKTSGKILGFQVLMTRRRKYDIEKYAEKVPVKYFLFDILFKDGNSLLSEPLSERKKALKQSFFKKENIDFVEYLITKETKEMEEFFLKATKRGNEGVIVKDGKSVYQAGVRGWNWIKFKKDYQKELLDTFDLAVVGGIYGTGKRTGTYGSLLVAAFEPKTNKYYSFTKVGTGFTDEQLSQFPKILDKYKTKEKHRLVETEMEVDVWFEPKAVMEIAGAEITTSPIHPVVKEKIKKGGLALRFPRFLRWREDKAPEQATTTEEIYQLYKKQ